MGKFEVTQEEFEALMGANPTKLKGPKSPVGSVTWDEAQEFLKKLNDKFKGQKATFRLPSEAEWEYACRAGTITAYHVGQELSKEQANIKGDPNAKDGFAVVVGSYAPNAFGLYDMHGNVKEWCADYYGPYDKAPQDGTAQLLKQSEDHRVRRGGAWINDSTNCRSSSRDHDEPSFRTNNGGFRVVVDIADDSPLLVKKDPPPIVKGPEVSFDLGNGIKLDVIKINAKGKTFLMGSPKEERERDAGKDGFDKEEQHAVTLGSDFYMGKFELTQEQYEAITGANPAKFKGPKNPVETVSWNEAQKFITVLNAKFTGRKIKFRLPSEAEWEYACRAGTTTAYHFGDTLSTKRMNYNSSKVDSTKPVGSYEPNAFGLYEMHGNVNEWCEDYYGPYSKAPADGTAQAVRQVSYDRVRRGGSWISFSTGCRSAYRFNSAPGNRDDFNGFRIAVDIADDSPVLPKKEPPPVSKGPEVSFDLGNGVKLDVVKINAKGKKFLMGSPKEEVGRKDDEDQHEVTFVHDFQMGKFEVTQEQYEAVMGKNPSNFKDAKNPVEFVSWNDAQEFLNKLNDKFKEQKHQFRLPSEAEWEYACRAGTTTPYHFGNTITTQQASLDKTPTRPRPVGSYEANAFGLYDMHGNVREWCQDHYGPYSKAPTDGTAQSVKYAGMVRTRRGGSWFENASNCRSAVRSSVLPADSDASLGFRVVVDVAK